MTQFAQDFYWQFVWTALGLPLLFFVSLCLVGVWYYRSHTLRTIGIIALVILYVLPIVYLICMFGLGIAHWLLFS